VARAPIEPLAAPAARPIERVSPSLGEDLRACGMRVAFRLDSRFDEFRKLGPAAALGLVSHELTEAVARGHFNEVAASELDQALAAEWDRRLAEKATQLANQWPLGTVPPPERWPGYQLARVRLLRHLSEEARRPRQRGKGYSAKPEVWLEVPGLALVGRVDRIERSNNDVELIDLKSGWAVEDEIRPAHRRQLLIYAYLWQAVSGNWPTKVSVQRPNGLRTTLNVDPRETREVAADLLARLQDYNMAIAADAPPHELASPSPEACAHCDYRLACSPFFQALDQAWGWYRRSLLGKVVARAEVGTAGVLEVAIEASNLDLDITVARVLGIPPTQMPPLGSRVAVVDAIPTPAPQDIRAVWDTQLLTWGSLPSAKPKAPFLRTPGPAPNPVVR
jgi:RecB family exonuclease